ncbi:hypothetical protein F3Y22_tig00110151pilonHSYRG00238 [Hibiscus syriacus]|uniref:Pentatricopeptide repeat-containing protein n=1 Tax=Hibiscus syriacus TaxID=106335 RepID=A0A6A3BMK4_HIBSY|nr:hypothetical protein F3Y22_tig00110151pilonHSYRG00238 [Hibiscus syriacus]
MIQEPRGPSYSKVGEGSTVILYNILDMVVDNNSKLIIMETSINIQIQDGSTISLNQGLSLGFFTTVYASQNVTKRRAIWDLLPHLSPDNNEAWMLGFINAVELMEADFKGAISHGNEGDYGNLLDRLWGIDRAIRNIDNIAKAVDLFDQMLSSGCSLHPKEMLEAGMKPDSVSYNSLITYFCKTEDFEIAGEVMKQMINQGVIPTTATYGALIQAYCSNGKIEDATKLFNDMSSLSKVPPNTLVYTSLIESLCKNNDIKGALSLMDDMKAKRVKPNTTTYNAVLKGLKKNNLLENAYGLMDGMIENACNPDCITMEILRELLSSVDGSKKLESFVQGKRVSPL